MVMCMIIKMKKLVKIKINMLLGEVTGYVLFIIDYEKQKMNMFMYMIIKMNNLVDKMNDFLYFSYILLL